jgi:hypothetical protein
VNDNNLENVEVENIENVDIPNVEAPDPPENIELPLNEEEERHEPDLESIQGRLLVFISTDGPFAFLACL